MAQVQLPVTQSAICPRCEGLPSRIPDGGQLYLWFPLGHTLGKALSGMREMGVAHERLDDRQGVLVTLAAGQLAPLMAHLEELLSGKELRDTQSLFTTEPGLPRLSAFPRVTPLARFIGMVHSDWLLDLLHEGRVTSHFQPIVHAADSTRPFAHEALLRGLDRAGALVPPHRLFGVARDAGLLFQLDLLARRTAIRDAARHELTGCLSSTSTRPRSMTPPSVSAPPSPRSTPPVSRAIGSSSRSPSRIARRMPGISGAS